MKLSPRRRGSNHAADEGKPAMTDLEVLIRNINLLTELLRVAREQLANPLLPAFERREANNQIGLLTVELRRQFQLMEAERGHSRK
jgi:hypothetical protein